MCASMRTPETRAASVVLERRCHRRQYQKSSTPNPHVTKIEAVKPRYTKIDCCMDDALVSI